MGSLVGHVAPGLGFFIIGLWHLLNHIKLHALRPNSYTSLPWFPTSKLKYLELFLIMGACSASIAMELFIGPNRHQPLDKDWTIPSNHLHNFEHSFISLSFFVYAALALVLDCCGGGGRTKSTQHGLTQILGAAAFGQQLLIFHLHSTDHMGLEGHYHWLLQIVIFISLLTTLMGIGYPNSFLISFVRSFSILFQGVWLATMGFMLWTPGFIPKDCFINFEDGHQVVRCNGHEGLERAKSLVNIEFSWYLIVFIVLSIGLYLFLIRFVYPEKEQEYESLSKYEEQDHEDVEAQKKIRRTKSFITMGKGSTTSMDIER
ncbi:transmembrane protein 45A-like [Impatiens glandulifera]|uniref:transmembrane protein 45A-like n=1 Tax=Impatiens glandulifera TaxID=253017 RepID=UPI001FB0B04A|nr:transmembrane protein 45A-like [Impatiens glandulifera]